MRIGVDKKSRVLVKKGVKESRENGSGEERAGGKVEQVGYIWMGIKGKEIK